MDKFNLPFPGTFFQNNELETNYSAACAWLESLGIDYRRTRYKSYMHDKELLFHEKSESVEHYGNERLKTVVERYLEASREMFELTRIATRLSDVASDSFLEQVQRMAKGHVRRDTDHEDQSRNFAFELDVASRFAYAGYKIDLTHVSDVVASVGGKDLHIECKRVTSMRKLDKRISHAKKQLKKRVAERSQRKGFAAFEVSSLVGSPEPAFPNVEAMHRMESSRIDGFTKEYEDKFEKLGAPHIVGLLTQTSTAKLIITEKGPLVGVCRAGTVMKLSTKKSVVDYVEAFWEKIGNQV